MIKKFYTTSDGSIYWHNNFNIHREDGPAIISPNGQEEWVINGKRHRVDGPAILSPGCNEWWINGKDITREVNLWMETQQISWPWDEETQAQFVLTFCC